MNPKLRIISIIPSAENAGTELAAIRKTLLFSEKGASAEIWSLSKSENFDSFAIQHAITLRKFPIKTQSPLSGFKNIFRLFFHTWKNRKVSIFHAYLPKSILIIFILSRLINISYIAGVRGKISTKNYIVEYFLRKSLLKAEFVICNARHLKETVRSRFKLLPDKILIVRNMVKPQELRSQIENQPPTAIVLANFLAYKGHENLLLALKMCRFKPKVILVGHGPEEVQIRLRIQELNLEDYVSIQTDQNLGEILEAVQFAVHPSETEGFSNAILEEMSFGLPVVAFDIEGNIELIQNNFNGLLVEAGNNTALSVAIEVLTTQVDLRTKLSAGAKETSMEYSPSVLYKNLTQIYSQTRANRNMGAMKYESYI